MDDKALLKSYKKQIDVLQKQLEDAAKTAAGGGAPPAPVVNSASSSAGMYTKCVRSIACLCVVC